MPFVFFCDFFCSDSRCVHDIVHRLEIELIQCNTVCIFVQAVCACVIYCNCRGLFKLKICQVIQDARLKTNATYTHNDFRANIS